MIGRPRCKRLHRTDLGAGLVEYALLIALVVLVCFVALQFFGGSVGNSLSRSGSKYVGALLLLP